MYPSSVLNFEAALADQIKVLVGFKIWEYLAAQRPQGFNNTNFESFNVVRPPQKEWNKADWFTVVPSNGGILVFHAAEAKLYAWRWSADDGRPNPEVK